MGGAASAGRTVRVALAALAIATLGPPARAAERRPSILLFVLDTVRFDAVSADGTVEGTTPAVDALAAAGIRYTHAYANAPWTLPSHASLFTGLYPSGHQVGWPDTWARDDLVMLAERLRDAGYETAGVVENPWLTEPFNMTQGFETFSHVEATPDAVEQAVVTWLGHRDGSRPYFLFVNVADPHSPYETREMNPFVPCCFAAEALGTFPADARAFFCHPEGHEQELAALHGFYLGDVARADAKLGRVLDLLRRQRADEGLVTVVTADHGELFGEHRQVEHMLGLWGELLHVPLVVHGLAGVEPKVVDAPVTLVDVVPSVLAWTGLPPATGLPGRTLALGGAAPARSIVAEWNDPGPPSAPDRRLLPARGRALLAQVRSQCGPDDRVRGNMRALLRYPMKLVWYEQYPPALYDLANDPQEAHDLAASETLVVRSFLGTLGELTRGSPTPLSSSTPPTTEPSPELLERLRALGYLGD
jgi:arylsulfatase A-like enzyme